MLLVLKYSLPGQGNSLLSQCTTELTLLVRTHRAQKGVMPFYQVPTYQAKHGMTPLHQLTSGSNRAHANLQLVFHTVTRVFPLIYIRKWNWQNRKWIKQINHMFHLFKTYMIEISKPVTRTRFMSGRRWKKSLNKVPESDTKRRI